MTAASYLSKYQHQPLKSTLKHSSEGARRFLSVISVFNGTVLHESCFNVYHQSLDTSQSIKRHSGFRGPWNSSLNVSYLSISHMVPSVNVIILAAVALIWQCTCLIKAGDTSWVRTLLPSAELGRLRQAARRNERRSHGVFARKIHATLWNHRWIMDWNQFVPLGEALTCFMDFQGARCSSPARGLMTPLPRAREIGQLCIH